MPNRYLRESLKESEAVNAIGFQAQVTWIHLILTVDDWGRCEASPKLLRPKLFPLRLDQVREADLERWIAECENAGLVRLYRTEGKEYLQMMKWEVGRAEKSRYPTPPQSILDACYLSGSQGFSAPRGKSRGTKADNGGQRGAKASDPDPDPDPDNDPDRDLRGRVDGFRPPIRSEEAVALAAERRTQAQGQMTQAVMDRAMAVLNLYPSKAKKDGRVVVKTMADQNALAYRIAENPDHPWEDHARLMQATNTPVDLAKWVSTMPDPVAFASLRDATAKAKPVAAPNFHLSYQPPEDDPL